MLAVFSKKVRRRLALGIALVAVGITAANVHVCYKGSVLESASSAATPVQADAILVLGAGVWPDGSLSTILQDRLKTAVQLWNSHASARILVSGDHGSAEYDELGPSLRYLREAGIPDDAIFLDHAGFDTYSACWRARHVFGARSIVVVTQAYHLPRALYFARSLGLSAHGVAADQHWYAHMKRFRLREIASRTIAPMYVAYNRTPRQPGNGTFDLSASGHATHDVHE
jgi:SanA protein